MQIKVFNEYSITKFLTDKKHIVISVRSPKAQAVKLPVQESRLNALFLDFHDIDERAFNISDRLNCKTCDGSGFVPEWKHIENGRCFECNREGMNLKLFSKQDALKILIFAGIYHDAEIIAVNCEAGISRSSAIAGALNKIYNGSDEYYFKHYCPNMLVYRKIVETYYEMQNNKS